MNQYPSHFIEAHLVISSVVGARGAGALAVGHLLRDVELPAILCPNGFHDARFSGMMPYINLHLNVWISSRMKIRLAEEDAGAIAQIYRPIVASAPISFEIESPDERDIA